MPSHNFSGGRFLDDEDEEDVSVLGMEVFGVLCAIFFVLMLIGTFVPV